MPRVKPPKRGTAAQTKKVGAICGAKKRQGGKCTLAAGWGTPHPGTGKCKLHGGSVPNHVKAAAKDEYRKLLGNPIEVNPYEAIMTCIKIRAGEVQWLSDRMAELDKASWVEETLVGKQFHLYARERQAAMQDLAKFSQMAISLGIAERQVRLAETYGELIANYTKRIIDSLLPHLDEEGKKNWPSIVREALLSVSQTRPELPAAA